MIDITLWTDNFIQTLIKTFGERVWFAGLQGSYARGEAVDTSDIDTVVILDTLTADDIKNYNTMLDTMPNRELVCGFISGKQEILNWEPSDLFQFYYDTKPIIGTLDGLLPMITPEAIDRAIKTGACNIYHGCVHNMLYDKSEDILYGLYKSASFVLQALCFKQTGQYITHIKDISDYLSDDDRNVINTFICLKSGGKVDFEVMSKELFEWSRKYIK
ncbi:MAG: nucleotidyltransferase domain-containing protein [Clostridia bacterium]|nr:nucleotidyltransferase domain-containing protein [Clostridia bacterium]